MKNLTLEDLVADLTGLELKEITPEFLLRMMRRAGAHYACVRDPKTQSPLTPLVGYAGRDGAGKQLVGHEYLNFGRGEEYPVLTWAFTARVFYLYQQYLETLSDADRESTEAEVVCGMPMSPFESAKMRNCPPNATTRGSMTLPTPSRTRPRPTRASLVVCRICHDTCVRGVPPVP
jgi:hypothetical protein